MILATLTCMLVLGGHTEHDLAVKGPNGWTFDARLVEPSGDHSGIAVLLIGGGIGNDLDWTLPGSIEVDGSEIPLTIDGTTHRDAPLIAHALADQGHAVMHYSTIAREDPKRELWPVEMTVFEPPDLLQLQHAMARALHTHPLTASNTLVLVAHSMGAQRACTQASTDSNISALILMGPAQMTRTAPDDPGRNTNRTAAMEQLGRLDLDRNGTVSGDEIPDSMDFDQDGTLRSWEVSANLARRNRQEMKPETMPDKHGIPFGEDSLRIRPVPTLVLYGNLDDAQGHHAPILQDLIKDGSLKMVEVRVLPDLGHQLGPVQANLAGPISQTAIQAMVDWIAARDNPEQP